MCLKYEAIDRMFNFFKNNKNNLSFDKLIKGGQNEHSKQN